MEYRNQIASQRLFRNWLKKKHKEPNPIQLTEISDSDEGESNDDYENDGFGRSVETGSCFPVNEFRVFVGTWNVAGRSPLGSLVVDLDDWLNLKDAADIYVLGFQEIVPLKTLNVIGAEDPIPGEKWNSLIGTTLNNNYGCPWLTPVVHPISSDDVNSVQVQGSENKAHSTPVVTPPKEIPQLQAKGQHDYTRYKLMASKKMVGVFISVWMKVDVICKHCVSNVKVCSVACGIMGCLGNKGSVSVSMSIDGTSFCFIAAHLASGEKNGDEVRRNYQVSEIFKRTSFPRLREDDHGNPLPLTILGHDRIFWFGDLNYRLCLEDSLARRLIKKKDWRALQEFDQLRKEQEYGGVFQGWKEGNIEFAPTYKYSSSNCNRYSGGLPGRTGEKQRTPAWCDKILWYGKGVKQLFYFRSESKFSDHRPVSALFSILVEDIKYANPRLFTLSTLLPPIFSTPARIQRDQNIEEVEDKGEDEYENEIKPTLFSLLAQKIKVSLLQDMIPINSSASLDPIDDRVND